MAGKDRAPSEAALPRIVRELVIPAEAGIHFLRAPQLASLSARSASGSATFAVVVEPAAASFLGTRKIEEKMQNSGNEAEKLLKTKEVAFCDVQKPAQIARNFAPQASTFDPASDSSVIHLPRPTARRPEFRTSKCDQP